MTAPRQERLARLNRRGVVPRGQSMRGAKRMATPKVLDEYETLGRALMSGCGLSRFGDGELNIALCRRDAPGQVYERRLSQKLREILVEPIPNLLVCLPRVFGEKPAKSGWQSWRHRMEMHAIIHEGQTYGSAFVSRPDYYKLDSWPAEYWAAMRSLWDAKPLILVRGDQTIPDLYDNASHIRLITGLQRDAWREHAAVLQQIQDKMLPGAVVALQFGPTATVLAYELAKLGIQALDLGKASRFYNKFTRATDA